MRQRVLIRSLFFIRKDNYKIPTAGLVMLGIEPKTQQLIMGIVFLVMVAVFADRETGMIVK